MEGRPKSDKSVTADAIDGLRHLGDHDAKPVGEKTINRIPAKGFSTLYGGMDTVVWANAKTAMPLRIETALPASGNGATMVMSDFKLDVPIEDSLFSMEIPAGYSLTQKTVKAPTIRLGNVEDEVAKLIGDYAKLNDSHFPASLNDWASLTAGFGNIEQVGQSDVPARIGGISGKLFSLPHGYSYVGKGEKLGDKDKLIFLIKPSPGVETTRGVYGNLRVADVQVNQLPTP